MDNYNNGRYHGRSNSYQHNSSKFSNKRPFPRQNNNLISTNQISLPEAKDVTTTQQRDISDKKTREDASNTSDPSSVVQERRALDNDATQKQKTAQSTRCRLFIGNVPPDLIEEKFKALFAPYGTIVEAYVNLPRGFAFVKLENRQQAETAKRELDGRMISNKVIRVRFASQGTIVKVKNLSNNVSNELLKEAFENYFGPVECALIFVDERGRSTGEGMVAFEKKPAAQKCLKECTEYCFLLTDSLRPISVETWEIRDDEDGLPEKLLIRDEAYLKERHMKPRFAEQDSFEHAVGLKWKELELQEKQLLDDVKLRMQRAAENLTLEIQQMLLANQAEKLREELNRRQEDLRRIDERRLQDNHRFRPMMFDPLHGSTGNSYFDPRFVSNNVDFGANNFGYDHFPQMPIQNVDETGFSVDTTVNTVYATNQVAHGYDHNQERKRARY